jgi:mutator protein MutT
MNKIQGVVAIIQDKSKFLLGKRSLTKKLAPGHWSPISGKIEPHETQEEAVVRECQEEVGLTVRPIKKVSEMDIDGGKLRLHWWMVEVTKGNAHLNNQENSQIGWFTVEEMESLKPFFKEDLEIFRQVILSTGHHST